MRTKGRSRRKKGENEKEKEEGEKEKLKGRGGRRGIKRRKGIVKILWIVWRSTRRDGNIEHLVSSPF
jgi:hypothetical protein